MRIPWRNAVAALAALVLAGCSEGGEQSAVSFEVSKRDCLVPVYQYDVIVNVMGEQPCAYAWRRGFSMGDFRLSELPLPSGTEISVLVMARSSSDDACVRCAQVKRLTLGTTSRVALSLEPVLNCGEGAVQTQILSACTSCFGGSDSYCAGQEAVTCTPSGEPQSVRCAANCRLGACQQGQDCKLKVYYPDKDGDTYGDEKQSQQACTSPAIGYVLRGGDCSDETKDAFPGQTAYFAQGYGTSKSFDYDCDGHATQEYPAKFVCAMAGMAGTGKGWVRITGFTVTAADPPACGAQGQYYEGVCAGGGGMLQIQNPNAIVTKTQSCR